MWVEVTQAVPEALPEAHAQPPPATLQDEAAWVIYQSQHVSSIGCIHKGDPNNGISALLPSSYYLCWFKSVS